MNDKWTNDLEKKMKDHTEIGPEGLWEDLEQTLFGEEKGKIIPLWSDQVQETRKVEKTVKSIWRKRLMNIAVAAVVFLIGGIGFYVNNGQQLFKQTSTGIDDQVVNSSPKEKGSNLVEDAENSVAIMPAETKEKEKEALVQNKESKYYKKESKTNNGVIQKRQEQLYTDLLAVDAELNQLVASKSNSSKEEQGLVKETIKDIVDSFVVEQEKNTENKVVANTIREVPLTPAEEKSSKRPFSFGVFSGNTSSNVNQQQNGYSSMNGEIRVGSNDPDVSFDNPSWKEIYAANLDKDVNTTIDHKRPVRFGASVYYQLNDKWGISTGLTYTRLSSELQAGSDDYKIVSDRVLHYVGIPIQMNYEVWKKGRFSTYANGGFAVEKSVAGTLKTKYKIGDVVEDGGNENVDAKGIQTSVNMSLGMEYKLGKNIGVYFEPGVRYYFDDGSSINTIYKEKPFDFNIQLGLRYSIFNNKKIAKKTEDI
ncbi:MAG: porin family protein [Flavobacteriaceae bacterium]|jgi:hypothetical protein|nr:porin family protein [Flavobacteriaceae bacterium]